MGREGTLRAHPPARRRRDCPSAPTAQTPKSLVTEEVTGSSPIRGRAGRHRGRRARAQRVGPVAVAHRPHPAAVLLRRYRWSTPAGVPVLRLLGTDRPRTGRRSRGLRLWISSSTSGPRHGGAVRVSPGCGGLPSERRGRTRLGAPQPPEVPVASVLRPKRGDGGRADLHRQRPRHGRAPCAVTMGAPARPRDPNVAQAFPDAHRDARRLPSAFAAGRSGRTYRDRALRGVRGPGEVVCDDRRPCPQHV